MCTYTASLIAAGAVPPSLVHNWHSAVLLGCYSLGLSDWLEHEYKMYKERCHGNCTPKGIEEWLQGYGYHVPGLEHLEAAMRVACPKALMATEREEGPR